MSTDWGLFNQDDDGRTFAIIADPHTFVQDIAKIFTINIDYDPEAKNSITLCPHSSLNFAYNNPDKLPEICNMLYDKSYVELYIELVEHQLKATGLYHKAAIIFVMQAKYNGQLEEYSHKCVPFNGSPWVDEYEEGRLYDYEPLMDLSRVSSISLAYDIPDNIGDYQFYFVTITQWCNVEQLLKINTEILQIWLGKDVPHDWHRLLAKVKYFMLYADAIIPDPPDDVICDNLLDYDIVGHHVQRWDVLDKQCGPSPARFGKTKSARS